MKTKHLVTSLVAIAILSAAWAGSISLSVHAPYAGQPNVFYYTDGYFPTGTVFSGSVSGVGLANGVSLAQDDYTTQYYILVNPGAPQGQSFSQSQTSDPLSSAAQVHYGVSATSNSPGAYCDASFSATW
jgi:hypothetical protein